MPNIRADIRRREIERRRKRMEEDPVSRTVAAACLVALGMMLVLIGMAPGAVLPPVLYRPAPRVPMLDNRQRNNDQQDLPRECLQGIAVTGYCDHPANTERKCISGHIAEDGSVVVYCSDRLKPQDGGE